ncbi:MAG: hypothetical protein J5930_00975 [Treponema sp.]|nr:hypothetical protein [Treponema sp.]
MNEETRIVSISILFVLSAFCFIAGIFLYSGNKDKKNSRRSLMLIEVLTGFLLLSDALAYLYRGNITATGYYMVRMSNFLVFTFNLLSSFFFCFYVCEFIQQSRLSFSILLKPRASIESGIPVQLFIVLFLCLAGVVINAVGQFTGLFYYFDEQNIYHRSSLYPIGVALGFLPGLISVTMLFQNKKKFQRNAFISLCVYFILPLLGIVFILFVYGFPWINIGFGLGALHLFLSSIKMMELEFYTEHPAVFSPSYKPAKSVYVEKKRLVRIHVWQTLSAVLGGILVIFVIVSITGISMPERTLSIEAPYVENDVSESVCITFGKNAEKHWIDEDDAEREGAQYDGVIYNNMKSTIITDWSFAIAVPQGSSIDPGPWNGRFTLSDEFLNVRKPREGDKENIHGADFYKVTPMKTLGFGCIMYAPLGYQPLEQKITFTYSSILKPLTNIIFDIFFGVIAALFIIFTTVMLLAEKILRVEEENQKLEATVKDRTQELEAEKDRSENLLLNILPKEIAEELTAHPEHTIAKEYPNVTVLFTDIVEFTKMSGSMSAEEVVTMLNKMFSMFDDRARREGIEKIKTIGDAYMAAAGLTEDGGNDGAGKMIRFAAGLLDDVRAFNETSPVKVQIRVGVNSGPLVAGVIGKSKFIYDIWGDTVNVASRMESTGSPMRIHVTEATRAQTIKTFPYSETAEIEVKGKGRMDTYYL